MARGDKVRFAFERLICEITGKEIIRLTPKGVLSHHPYFYNKMFTKDGNKMILASKINGVRDYYLLDLRTEEAVQLTECPELSAGDGGFNGDDFGGFISPCDKYLYYTKSGDFSRVDLETLEEEVVYGKRPGWDIGGPINMSTDSRYLIMVHGYQEDTIVSEGSPWKNFIKQGKSGKRSRLVLFDMDTETEKILVDTKDYGKFGLTNNQWLTHPLMRPYDNNTISYCHEGLGGTVDARIWLTVPEGKTVKCAREHDFPEQIISHEFWFKDGSKLGYVRIDDKGGDKGKICMIDPETLEEEVIVDLPRCSHFITSHDDRYVIADGAMPDAQFMTPELVKEEDRVYPEDLFLYLVDIEKKSYEKLVCHRSSFESYGHNQDAHPHPSFTPDNQRVVYTSDFEGIPSVYMVKI